MNQNENENENEKIEVKDRGNEFLIHHIYVKDLSYEAPSVPELFNVDWKPDLQLDIQVNHSEVELNHYEVILKITLNVSTDNKLAFIVEIEQAGIFSLIDFNKLDLERALGCYCPTILFPYAREAISSEVSRGGFPAIFLSPINFEALYQEYMNNQYDTNDEKADAKVEEEVVSESVLDSINAEGETTH